MVFCWYRVFANDMCPQVLSDSIHTVGEGRGVLWIPRGGLHGYHCFGQNMENSPNRHGVVRSPYPTIGVVSPEVLSAFLKVVSTAHRIPPTRRSAWGRRPQEKDRVTSGSATAFARYDPQRGARKQPPGLWLTAISGSAISRRVAQRRRGRCRDRPPGGRRMKQTRIPP